MAANYRDEMLLAEDMNPALRKKKPRTGSDPAPVMRSPSAPPDDREMMIAKERSPSIGQRAGAAFQGAMTGIGAAANAPVAGSMIGMTARPTVERGVDAAAGFAKAALPAAAAAVNPTVGAAMSATMNPSRPQAQTQTVPPAPPAAGGMGDVKDSERDMLMLGDTEEGRRQLAMLRKQRNLTQASIEGAGNRYSKFYDPAQSPAQRAELILAKESMNQELGTAERAANPPRYADSPNKSPEMMLYEEQARERQRQAVTQANSDSARRTEGQTRSRALDSALYERMLATENAGASMAKAGASQADATATRAKLDADLANFAGGDELSRSRAMQMRGSSPTYMPAVSGLASSIRQLSGKAVIGSDDRVAAQRMTQSLEQIQQMPEELQNIAAAEILHTLGADNLDLPKEAFQDSAITWLLSRPSQWLNMGTAPRTNETQAKINQTLENLRRRAAAAGINPQMFSATEG